MVLLSAISLGSVSPAAASGSYTVPESGLSFDATDTVETDVCTTGYGNVLTDEFGDPITEDDEINYLIQSESVTFLNVAEIDGVSIDARVTLSDILGMATQDGRPDDSTAPVLERLDKCEEGSSDAGLIEARFDSVEDPPSEAYFELTIDFLAAGTPVTLSNLILNVEDVDSDQFIEIDDFSSVRLGENRGETDVQEYSDDDVIDVDGVSVTVDAASSTARRYFASGSSSSSDGAEETDKHVVEVTYTSTESVVVKFGAYRADSGSFDLDFRGFTFASDSEGSGGSGGSESATTSTLAVTGPDSSMWGLGVGAVGLVIVGAGLAMQAVRRRSLSAG